MVTNLAQLQVPTGTTAYADFTPEVVHFQRRKYRLKTQKKIATASHEHFLRCCSTAKTIFGTCYTDWTCYDSGNEAGTMRISYLVKGAKMEIELSNRCGTQAHIHTHLIHTCIFLVPRTDLNTTQLI